MTYGTRDLIGYGRTPPRFQWPNNARIAVNFVINYEEGAEANIQDGDETAEYFLAELAGLKPAVGHRNRFTESIFEYGSRAGIWRLLRLFDEFNVPVSVFAVGLALQRNPEVATALGDSAHEIVGHGYRWIDYQSFSRAEEWAHLCLTLESIKNCTGKTPIGWYTGRRSQQTRELVVEAGLQYDSDDYSDDLPYWTHVNGQPHLILPYTFDNNDSKYALSPGWMSGDDFYRYLCASFDCLYREGAESPKMMTIGLHPRLSGRPGRAEVIRRFLTYICAHSHVWICRRSDIAKHWMACHIY